MADIANFEEPFNGAIPLLVSMTDEMVAALNNSMPDTWTFASMPFATVYRLLLLSASVSHSGALCLASAETSLGSAFMIRGLLEAVSHLYYIGVAPDGDNRPPACRALDFEMGAIDEWGDTVSLFPSSPEMRKWHNDHNLKREQMYDIAQELGYPIKKRRWSDVPKTIKTMADTENREWLLPSWRSTSTLVHMYGVDFAFTNHSSGSSDFVWATCAFRARSIINLTLGLLEVAHLGLAILGAEPGYIDNIKNKAQQLVGLEVIVRSANGEFDKQ